MQKPCCAGSAAKLAVVRAVAKVEANGGAAGRAMKAMLFRRRPLQLVNPMRHQRPAIGGAARGRAEKAAVRDPARAMAMGAATGNRLHNRRRKPLPSPHPSPLHASRAGPNASCAANPALHVVGIGQIGKKTDVQTLNKKGGRAGGLARPPLPGDKGGACVGLPQWTS
jgi:hypothetical protein